MTWLKRIAIALAALAAVAILALLLARLRPSAGTVDVAIDIARPAVQIWPWLNEPGKIKQWVSWTKEVRNLDPGRNGVGARDLWVTEDRNNGNALMETEAISTAYEPHRRMAANLQSTGVFAGEVTYELRESGGQTTLRMIGRYQYLQWFANLLEPLITPAARDKTVADLATLKRLVEATSASASVSSPAPDPSKP
jgi:hypothetical protein